ncbi:alpha/beta hydrolase [Planococcus liqunii]|uniref:alpha/beta hydrolase n=1 Tax=Planococcus liqunii TaxID=3058394 RepID=UPI002627A9D7|nr:alpha/beta hydrolase [Planococcus sp. N056]WKA49369.1 alpha/beta hydrolase [Planococcus sp. N056]
MMEHIFKKGSNPEKPVLLLLHGTGGNEQSLLSLAPMVDAEASVLSIRGNVLEHGMPRFFRRLSEGVFDEEDLVFRTNELNRFLDEASAKYEFSRNHIVAIGYSNGANIAASLLYHFSDALNGAILHHPMVPRRGIELQDLAGKQVFIAAGTNDPITPVKEAEELHASLESANASVEVHWENNGHQLTGSEVEAARQWYQRKYGQTVE